MTARSYESLFALNCYFPADLIGPDNGVLAIGEASRTHPDGGIWRFRPLQTRPATLPEPQWIRIAQRTFKLSRWTQCSAQTTHDYHFSVTGSECPDEPAK